MRRVCSTGVACALLCFWASGVSAQGNGNGNGSQLTITSATVSSDQSTLLVTGANFGATPTVTLGDLALGGVQVGAGGTSLSALMPALAPGSYRLVVARGNGAAQSDDFDLAVGVTGPTGPQGPAGPVGPVGPAGPPRDRPRA